MLSRHFRSDFGTIPVVSDDDVMELDVVVILGVTTSASIGSNQNSNVRIRWVKHFYIEKLLLEFPL